MCIVAGGVGLFDIVIHITVLLNSMVIHKVAPSIGSSYYFAITLVSEVKAFDYSTAC